MTRLIIRYRHYGHFLSGLVILLFGMIAIHTTVRLQNEHVALKDAYHTLAEHAQSGGYDNIIEDLHSHENLLARIETYQGWMYWAVIAMGMTGFILIVLNADKLSKLEKANQEKIETLRLLEYRLAAMEATLEGIGIIDKQGNLTYMNKALMTLHAIAPEDTFKFIGHPWTNLYTEKGREDIKAHVIPHLMREGFWRGVSAIKRSDDKVARAEMSLTLLPDGGFIGTARDVTEEERAAALHKETQEQLFQAQKMEAIGRLAGGIAHDFNNILAAMNGYAEFLVEDLPKDTQSHTFARNILQAGRQARDLVDKILAFSRRKDSENAAIDIRAPLDETLAMLHVSLPKTIEVVTDIAPSSVCVQGNETQIGQLLMNLCVNAGDSMEDEKGVLSITLHNVNSSEAAPVDFLSDEFPAAGEVPAMRIEDISPGHTRLVLGALKRDTLYARISVGDSGCGMSRVIMEHIFEPFFTTKPVHKGTGLGLSTVHGVISAHSGALMINSRLGQGTRFDIYIPAIEGGEEGLSPEMAEKLKEMKGGTILLVEDQDDVRAMTSIMLKRLGYSVKEAATGLEALDLIRDAPGGYDAVLTDQNMPRMTGIELVEQAQPDFPDLPFVLLSGYAEEKLEDYLQNYPAIRAVIRKPVAQKQLGDVMQNVILRAKQAQDAA